MYIPCFLLMAEIRAVYPSCYRVIIGYSRNHSKRFLLYSSYSFPPGCLIHYFSTRFNRLLLPRGLGNKRESVPGVLLRARNTLFCIGYHCRHNVSSCSTSLTCRVFF